MTHLRTLAATALALAALLAACGGQNVPIDAELGVADHTAVFDGQPQMPEITFDPPGAEIGAEVVVTPEGAAPLESGTWPIDAGLYTVVVRASADQGGREAEGTLTIAPRPIDVVPDAGQGKVFDAAEPPLTFAFVDPAGEDIVPSSASGALVREDGESVGTYAFALGDLDAGANFALALVDGAPVFTIAASDLGSGGIVVTDATVTFDGEAHSVDVAFDPPAADVGAVVTYGDLDAGVLPVDAGTYEVSAVAGTGYVGTATGTLVIAPRPIDVVPDAGQGKVFDAAEPPLTFAFVDPAGEGIVPSSASGALVREAGEVLGTYAFALGDLDAGANFALALVDGAPVFTIAASDLGSGGIVVTDATVVFDGEGRSVDVAFDPPAAGVGAVVTYGDLDAGVLPVAAGTYAVSVVAGPGYVGGGSGILTIAPRPVDLVPSADQGKEYGAEEPTYGYGFVDPSGAGVVPTSATGALVRSAGEDVGSYAFTIGDLDAGGNFAVTLTAGTFEITPRPLTLAGFTVEGKTYDGTTNAFGATFLDDRLAGDDVTVGFDVAFASSSAGASVVANFTDLAITGGAEAGNYVLATTSGSATAAIARRALSVTNVLWADKVYDGGTGATASATLVTTDVVGDDAVSLVAQLVGEFASDEVGTHAVVGSFLLTGADAANYVVDPQPTDSAVIKARPVTLDDATLEAKTYDGTQVASVTGTLRAASGFDRGVLLPDVADLGFAGTFAQADATVDPVAVTVTLTGDAAGNYVLDPIPALSGAIAPAEVTVTPDAGQSKVYGDADPDAFGFATEGLVGDATTTGALVRVGGETVGSYAFEIGTLSAGTNYVLVLADEAASFEITTRPITLTAAATSTVYGESGDLTAALAEGSSLPDGDVLTGELARPEHGVGDHTFGLGSATLTDGDAADMAGNYAVTFANYAVTARPLTITADDAGKTYGDPLDLGSSAFTVSANDFGTGLAGAEVVTSVALVSDGTAVTATVVDGPYAIVASDAVGGEGFDPANYAITYVPGSLTVEPRLVTLSGAFSVAEKAYDGTTEAGTVDVSGLVLNNLADGDDVSVEAVATFADALVGDAKVATLSAVMLVGADAGNYSVSLEGAPTTTGTVVKAAIEFGITIAATDFGTEVVYDGDRTFQPNVTTSPAPAPLDQPVAYDVEITYDADGSSVASFNAVGTYTVTVTAADPRYVGSSTQVVEVLARPITIASSATVKKYGTDDPIMTPSLAHGTTFGRNEAFVLEGALGYDAGDQVAPNAVGSYPLELGSVVVLRGLQVVTRNYAITFASDFEIVPATVVVAPDADQSKAYGDADLDFGYGTEGLLHDDVLTGALQRDPGEDVGTYAFTLGDLDAGANYTLVLADPAPTYEIVARAITLTTATPAYTYGDADVDLVAVLAEGSTLREGDALAGAVALSETDAGVHAFLLGSAALTLDQADVASNYAIAFADYTMAARAAIVAPLAGQGKTYGDVDPMLEYTVDLLDGDALTGALGRLDGEDVGTYTFTVGGLENPNYALAIVDGAPTFAIAPRTVTLEATVASKEFSTPDPDLSPLLGEGTLRVGDALVGALAHVGSDVGTYPLEIGSVQVMREDADVGGNYTFTFGSFTIDPLPVDFDITNADLVVDGDPRTHVFFGDGSEPIRGLTVAASPEGATPTYRLSYRWTHDADHVAFSSPISVQRIQGLGTYQVTVTDTSANHVGTSVLTVWVTDAIGVAFAEPTYEALVGATVNTQVLLVGPDGTPRTAGPVPIAVDLLSDTASVAFTTGEEPLSATSVQIAAGASGADVGVIASAFEPVPAVLFADARSRPTSGLASGTATFATTAQLAFAPTTVAHGAGATTAPVSVRLTGFEGISVLAPSDLVVDLTATPLGVVFRDADDTEDVTFVTVPAGTSEAGFRMRAEVPGAYTVAAAHDGLYTGVAPGLLEVAVAPRPTVSSIEPGTAAKAQTIDLVLTGTGFAEGVTVQFSGTDVAVDSVSVDAGTQLTVRATIGATTDVGTRHVTVTNLDGGTSTTADALTLTVPTLTANDDGRFAVVEGGNRALSIASDLLTNDTWTGTTAWGFDGVTSATGVTYGVAGDVLTLTAAAGDGGTTASLTYRIRDAVFGTTATATVAIDVTLAPVDAILFTDTLEFDDFLTTEYTVPTFADVFNTWPRFDGSQFFTSGPYSPNAEAWYLEGDTVVQPNNVSPGVGFVSPDGFEYYTFEATLYSGGSDNDSIGLVIAFGQPDGSNLGLVAHRTGGGNQPYAGWGLTLLQGSSYTTLVEPTVDAFTANANWLGKASRVQVERIGDIVRIQATDWFTENVATATPAYDPQSLITIDLATGIVTYRSGTAFVDYTLPSTQRTAVASLRGPQSYGYYTYSQPDSRYYNIVFEGGAAQDTAILLTGYDVGSAAYTGSEVWRFLDGSGWSQTAGTIQTELDFPRDVTSVASPNPGSAYPAGYSVFGDRFRIEATTVVPLVD